MFTTRPEIQGTFGVVASTHWLASAVGMGVLERGGNAFDAACAAGFTLQVVEPHLNGPAGDVPILLCPTGGPVRVLCGQGPAPMAATIEHFRGLDLERVPGTGLLAAVVPGAFDAWLLLLRDHGTLRLRQILEPAISYAEHGYPLVPRIGAAIEGVRALFVSEWPSSAAIYLPGGEVPEPFTLFRNRELAATYARIVREAEAASADRAGQIEAARRIWREGWIAEAIDRFCRTPVMDVTGRRHAGLLTAGDLARWQASYEEPVTYDYGRFTICKCGPWSQGPVLLQQLALLDGLDLEGGGPTGAEFVHLVVECAKLAFADREAFYGDPDFVEVPLEMLLSKAYNDGRRRLIGDSASLDLSPGRIEGFEERAQVARDLAERSLEALAAGAGAGEPTVAREPESGDTCHVDVIDRFGNMVAATPSGGWLQSSPVIPGLGFALGTRAQMFWLDVRSPSALAPGRRPRSTLSPSLALRDGEPYMAFGTPGGDQQDQWSLLLLLHHVHHGMNLQQAIDCPAFHSEHFPNSFYPRVYCPGLLAMESRFPEATIEALRRRGHVVELGGPWSEGRLSAACRDGALLKAGANPRGMQGYAVGR